MSKPMIYFDNNATTIVPPEVIKEMVKWINKGNPSASYKTAVECRNLMKEFRDYIAKKCNFISYEEDTKYTNAELPKLYQIVFTSGASESNNTILRSIADAYKFNTSITPHIIVSSIEHKTIIDCANQLAGIGRIEVTFVSPDKLGFIQPESIEKHIKSNTALICVMHANNETGAINNIKRIGAIAHSHQVPFFTDDVQSFGKYSIDPIAMNVDAFSVSFHKLHGPQGVGLLVIKRQFLEGFHLMPQVCGSQNCGFRGGTENIPGIAASYIGTKITWADRRYKNDKMKEIKQRIITELGKRIPCQNYADYLVTPTAYPMQIVFLSTADKIYLPNTLMIAVIKKSGDMCNIKLKKSLEDAGIIVSIGSACNTSSSKASHVLTEMGVGVEIKKGTIRISLAEENTLAEADIFVEKFIQILKNM